MKRNSLFALVLFLAGYNIAVEAQVGEEDEEAGNITAIQQMTQEGIVLGGILRAKFFNQKVEALYELKKSSPKFEEFGKNLEKAKEEEERRFRSWVEECSAPGASCKDYDGNDMQILELDLAYKKVAAAGEQHEEAHQDLSAASQMQQLNAEQKNMIIKEIAGQIDDTARKQADHNVAFANLLSLMQDPKELVEKIKKLAVDTEISFRDTVIVNGSNATAEKRRNSNAVLWQNSYDLTTVKAVQEMYPQLVQLFASTEQEQGSNNAK
jgi:hypothetical protein